MLLFEDEPRFKSQFESTDEHVGPGSYFSFDNEEIRSGWRRKSFSLREPMSPPSFGAVHRNIHHSQAQFFDETPGPGHYHSSQKGFGPMSGNRNQSFTSPINPNTPFHSIDTSSRLPESPREFTLRDGILFKSTDHIMDNENLGPGAYEIGQSSFQKKSFNVRANGSISPVKKPLNRSNQKNRSFYSIASNPSYSEYIRNQSNSMKNKRCSQSAGSNRMNSNSRSFNHHHPVYNTPQGHSILLSI